MKYLGQLRFPADLVKRKKDTCDLLGIDANLAEKLIKELLSRLDLKKGGM